jgi:cysteinyl-tRNA synthetase
MSMKSLGETLDIHCGGEDLVFPHHENEIAQSEALTGKTFARFWIHARFLLVEGEKMSKSLGNFYTLRDLVLMGHKPSAIRYLLSSVPYRKQLNFTFDGLKQAANSVERLRLFKNRVAAGNFHPGSSAPEIIEITVKTRQEIEAALSDDMNTARALAAVFDMVRAVNSVLDRGEFRPQDVPEVLSTLNFFDSIFAVLVDDDAAKVKKIVEWAEAEDLGAKISPTAREIAGVAGLSDAEIDKRIAEMQNARKSKDFARGDAIRNELNQMGIIVEVTKDGARWRRK